MFNRSDSELRQEAVNDVYKAVHNWRLLKTTFATTLTCMLEERPWEDDRNFEAWKTYPACLLAELIRQPYACGMETSVAEIVELLDAIGDEKAKEAKKLLLDTLASEGYP